MRIPAIPAGGFQFCHGLPQTPQAVGYSDGSVKRSRASFGGVLYQDDRIIGKTAVLLPGVIRDSNVPELEGLLAVMTMASTQGVSKLICLLDSYQAVECLQQGLVGKLRYPQVAAILARLPHFDYFEARNIPNRYNKQADQLARAVLC